jgi:hypothetical protein
MSRFRDSVTLPINPVYWQRAGVHDAFARAHAPSTVERLKAQGVRAFSMAVGWVAGRTVELTLPVSGLLLTWAVA